MRASPKDSKRVQFHPPPPPPEMFTKFNTNLFFNVGISIKREEKLKKNLIS